MAWTFWFLFCVTSVVTGYLIGKSIEYTDKSVPHLRAIIVLVILCVELFFSAILSKM